MQFCEEFLLVKGYVVQVVHYYREYYPKQKGSILFCQKPSTKFPLADSQELYPNIPVLHVVGNSHLQVGTSLGFKKDLYGKENKGEERPQEMRDYEA